ncbi:MAG: hypothetical protein ABEJ02_02105 [Candidatus Paceibacteria bacterium]
MSETTSGEPRPDDSEVDITPQRLEEEIIPSIKEKIDEIEKELSTLIKKIKEDEKANPDSLTNHIQSIIDTELEDLDADLLEKAINVAEELNNKTDKEEKALMLIKELNNLLDKLEIGERFLSLGKKVFDNNKGEEEPDSPKIEELEGTQFDLLDD